MSSTELINPATEEVLRSVEHADAAAVDDAVRRALAAQRRWARLAPAERAAGLRAFAAAVDAHVDELAALEVANSGHPIASAEWEAGHVRDVLSFYAASPERLSGKQIPVAGGLDVTFNEPLGVVGVITPWNFPMMIASWGIAPALAAGNAVLVKPAEWTPLTTIRLAELAVEAGLDADLLQVLPGTGAVVGQRFVTHPGVRKVVFTGSTEVGKRVMAGAAAHVKRVTLELGGKSANIVFADCDLERAAATAPAGVFDNAGQDCCARSRILVQRSVYDRFMELLEPAVKRVVVGDPTARDTEMGPLVSAAHRDKVVSYVPDDAPVAFRGTAPTGRRILVCANGSHAAAHRPRGHRGDLRPGGHRVGVRRRARRRRAGQRHRLRAVRVDLDRRPVPRAAGVARRRGRQPVGEFALVGAVQHALRRFQTVGAGPRAGPGRAAAFHRDQERVHRH